MRDSLHSCNPKNGQETDQPIGESGRDRQDQNKNPLWKKPQLLTPSGNGIAINHQPRARGEVSFNVSRVIGQARSTIVDTIYAHTVDSEVAGVSESAASCAGLSPSAMPEPPKPTPPSGQPRLRVIDGGRSVRIENQRDVRKPIENAPDRTSQEATSD